MSLESLEVAETSAPVEQEMSEPVTDTKDETAVDNGAEQESKDEAVESKDEPVELTDTDKVKLAMQKRIDRQTAKYKRMEEEHQKAQAEIETLRSTQEQNAPENDGQPQEEDFDTVDEWLEAQSDWRAEQKFNNRIKEQEELKLEQAHQREFEARQTQFNERINEFKADFPDYSEREVLFNDTVEDLVEKHGNSATLQVLSDYIMQSESAPSIIYELGENADLASDLAVMKPMQALEEIVKLKLSVQNRKPEKAKSNPKPIKPLNSTGRSSKTLDDMSPDELMEHMASIRK